MTPLLKTALMPYGTAYAIEPGAARQIQATLRTVDMAAHIRAFRKTRASGKGSAERADDPSYEMNGSVAMLSLSGPLTKQSSSMQPLFGGTSTEEFCAALRSAGNDPAARSVVVVADTPGGSVDGCAEANAVLRDVAALKPVYVYVPDLCASAGYWISCGASAIYAGPAAILGSIGCYTVMEDTSRAAEAEGRQVTVIGSGEMKGAGQDGTVITEAQKSETLRMVNDLNAQFVQAVSKGRKMSLADARGAADGRVYVGEKAEALGLTDGTLRLSEMVARLEADPAALIPESKNHPNARMGNRNARRANDTSPKETQSMSKALFATALAALGLHTLAGKAMSAPDDNPEALVSLMAGDMKAEVDAQVLAHPVLGAAITAGIDTPEKMNAFVAEHKTWATERTTRLEAEKTAQANALASAQEAAAAAAVAAFGQNTPELTAAQKAIKEQDSAGALSAMTAAYKAVRPAALKPGAPRQTTASLPALAEDTEPKQDAVAKGLDPGTVYSSRRPKAARR